MGKVVEASKPNKVPPDGGWGWVIVLAMGLQNIIVIPIIQCYGLIYKDTFKIWNFSSVDNSIIINTNAAGSMLTGLINGPLLRKFSYRKVSIFSAIFITVGLIMTAYSHTFITMLISFGIVTSFGMGMGMSSYPLAFNSYFKVRRNKAMGIATTLMGLGPILMPQLISFLLENYNIESVVLIIAGIATHCFIAALLLQPVEWHMVEKKPDEEQPVDKKSIAEKKKKSDKLSLKHKPDFKKKLKEKRSLEKQLRKKNEGKQNLEEGENKLNEFSLNDKLLDKHDKHFEKQHGKQHITQYDGVPDLNAKDNEKNNAKLLELDNSDKSDDEDVNSNFKRMNSFISNHEVYAVYGYDTPFGSTMSLSARPRRMSNVSFKPILSSPRPFRQSFSSIDSEQFSSDESDDESDKRQGKKDDKGNEGSKRKEEGNGEDKKNTGNTKPETYNKEEDNTNKEPTHTDSLLSKPLNISAYPDNLKNNEDLVYNELSVKKEKPKSCGRKYLDSVVNFFDLTLMKDPIFVNIIIGMSLAVFAEMNFSLLTPFILDDMKLSTQQIATFLSSLSIADLTFRFFAPFIGDYLDKPPRIMYMFSLLLLVGTRFALVISASYSYLLAVAVALGVAKGIRSVYMSLVIPSYVPIERYAAASGLQMVLNGLIILFAGPLMGTIRNATGSYVNCIFILNGVTLTTFLCWSIELIYVKYKSSKRKAIEVEEPNN